MNANELIDKSRPFFEWLVQWLDDLPSVNLEEIDPAKTAVISVDLIRCFTTEGPLASERIQGVVPETVRLFKELHDMGVHYFVLLQDAHTEDTPEFSAYPGHCLAGSSGSKPVPEFEELPFFDSFTIFNKNSLSSSWNTDFPTWLDEHPGIKTYIIVGDCTDLCVYETAMDLRMRANAHNIHDVRVIVPEDCVQTFSTSVETAKEIGAKPHPAELLHRIFLYQMVLNGVEVVKHVG